MRRTLIAILALGMATTGMAACGGDSTSPTVSIAGDYSLQLINGVSLPYTFTDGSTVTSDVLSLYGDGSFSETAQYSDGTRGVNQGFYSNNHGAITFNDETLGQTYSGSLSGSVLTEISNSGPTYVYRKD